MENGIRTIKRNRDAPVVFEPVRDHPVDDDPDGPPPVAQRLKARVRGVHAGDAVLDLLQTPLQSAHQPRRALLTYYACTGTSS